MEWNSQQVLLCLNAVNHPSFCQSGAFHDKMTDASKWKSLLDECDQHKGRLVTGRRDATETLQTVCKAASISDHLLPTELLGRTQRSSKNTSACLDSHHFESSYHTTSTSTLLHLLFNPGKPYKDSLKMIQTVELLLWILNFFMPMYLSRVVSGQRRSF